MRPPSLKLNFRFDSPSRRRVTPTPMVSAVCGVLVVMMVAFSGCQSFKSPQWIQDASNLGRKNVDQGASDASPANRRKPYSVESLTVDTNQPPLRPSSLLGPDNQDDSLSENELLGLETTPVEGLSLENVGLKRASVEIESGSMDDIDEATRKQLPAFVESAVSPLGSNRPVPIAQQAPRGNATERQASDSPSLPPIVTKQMMENQASENAIAKPVPIVRPSDIVAKQGQKQTEQRISKSELFQLNDNTLSNFQPSPRTVTGETQVTPSSDALANTSPTPQTDPQAFTLDSPEKAEQTLRQMDIHQQNQVAQNQTETNDGQIMRIVADSSGQRSDGMSSSVSRLFGPQKQPAVSSIPGSDPAAIRSSPAIQTVGYDEEVQQNAAPARYAFSDSRPGRSAEISASVMERPTIERNSVSQMAPPAPINEPQPLPTQPIASFTAEPESTVQPVAMEPGNHQPVVNQPIVNQPEGRRPLAMPINHQPAGAQPLPANASATWVDPLDAAIRQLDSQLSKVPEADVEVEQRIRLHLMKMIAGEPVAQQLNLEGIDPERVQFWQHQLRALEILLSDNQNQNLSPQAKQRRRATLAAEQLSLASDQLANDSGMRLRNCAFSTEVLGFGQIREAKGPFLGGQQLLIYCEIDNYTLKQINQVNRAGQTETMQQAELQGHYSIVDKDNRVVHQFEYQPVKDIAQRRRKDFYMFFPVTLPKLPAGRYELHLSLEDKVGGKVASCLNDLSFEIVSQAYTASQADQQTVPVYRRR